MKKNFAILLSALLVAASLTGCSNKPAEKPDAENNLVENNNAENNNTEVNGETLTLDEMFAKISEKAGTTTDDSTVVMTLGDYDITLAEFRYYYMSYAAQFAQYYGVDWKDDADYAEQFDEFFAEAVKMCGIVFNLAEEQGISLTEEEFNNNVLALYDEFTEQYGDEFETKFHDDFFATGTFMLANETAYNLYNKLFTARYGEGTEIYVELNDKTLAELSDSYVRAKHVLVQFPTNDDGSDVTDEQKAETLAKAMEVKEKADAGENFDTLIADYNEDPGMTTYTDGYYFTTGKMVAAFEEAAFALGDNEISDIVETPYGYHIIKRLPVDDAFMQTEAYIEQYSAVFDNLAYADFDEYFADLMDKVETVKVEGFDELVAPVYEEADTYLADLKVQYEALYGSFDEE